jgi:hypothetical protein
MKIKLQRWWPLGSCNCLGGVNEDKITTITANALTTTVRVPAGGSVVAIGPLLKSRPGGGWDDHFPVIPGWSVVAIRWKPRATWGSGWMDGMDWIGLDWMSGQVPGEGR